MNYNKSASDNQSRPLRAVHVGISGFPFGSAAINKCLAVYESVHRQGVEFLIINNRAIHARNVPVPIQMKGTVNGMTYVYTCPSPYRAGSFLARNIGHFLGRIREVVLLIRLGISGAADVMFYYPTNGSFFELFVYRAIGKIFGINLVAHYVEYRTAFTEDQNAIQRWKHSMYDKYFMRFVDAVLPISEYLIQQLASRQYRGPMLKVPPLTDFSQFQIDVNSAETKYFLYVGSAAYLSAIQFITDAFEKTRLSDFSLYLVINGNEAQMSAVRRVVSSMDRHHQVKIFSKLKYAELVQMYLQAKALLIPLTDNITDVARFPQKVAEYLASGNTVITTQKGEMPYYFRDGDNALMAADYDTGLFADKMNFVIDSPSTAAEIGRRGYETGRKYFDLHSYGPELKELIVTLYRARTHENPVFY